MSESKIMQVKNTYILNSVPFNITNTHILSLVEADSSCRYGTLGRFELLSVHTCLSLLGLYCCHMSSVYIKELLISRLLSDIVGYDLTL